MKYAVTFMALIWLALPQLVAAESSATLDGIKKSGTVRIGFRENEPPMSYRDESGKPIGYSIDLCTRIVNEIKSTLKKPDLTTEFVPVTAANRFQAITDNKIDILCGSTTETLSRAKLVDFTQLTFVTGASLLSLEQVDVGSVSDLQGKKVAVVKGTTTIDHLTRALKDAVSAAVVVPVDTAADGMKALVSGKVDAFTADQVILIGLAITHDGPEKFAIDDDVFSFEPFALAIRRNDSDFRLLANQVLSRLNRTGQITPIYVRWFGKFTKTVPTLLEAMYILNATPE
jgi:ABC-type amino acid transport substrate-binding protein